MDGSFANQVLAQMYLYEKAFADIGGEIYVKVLPKKLDEEVNPLGDFLNPALALLGQGLNKSPIGQKLDFANHPYLCAQS
jgi:hypothetical protein